MNKLYYFVLAIYFVGCFFTAEMKLYHGHDYEINVELLSVVWFMITSFLFYHLLFKGAPFFLKLRKVYLRSNSQYDFKAMEQINGLGNYCAITTSHRLFRLTVVLFLGFIFFTITVLSDLLIARFIVICGSINFLFLLFFRIYDTKGIDFQPLPESFDDLKDLPSYSVIVPLKYEHNVVDDLIKSLRKIDYPINKLEILLVVEKNDRLTLEALKKAGLPNKPFEILLIESGYPATKGRALQHALSKIKGEFVTVFDAEDDPDPDQLKKAARAIDSESAEVCYQAILEVKNPRSSFINRFYFAEYVTWYRGYIRRMSKKGLPFGLGGNSFHLKTSLLKRIGGWDPFNVTEDADLAIRMMRSGVKIKMLDSVTRETSSLGINEWLSQRRRWAKGLLVTLFVHFGSKDYKTIGFDGWFSFWSRLISGVMLPISSMIVLWFTIFSIVHFIEYSGEGFFANPFSENNQMFFFLIILFGMSLLIASFNNFWILKKSRIKINLLVLPVFTLIYWILYNVAGVLGILDFLIKPYYWHKTAHKKL